MTGTRPVVALAPLEYRYGLDAAMSLLAAPDPLVADDASSSQPLVLCNVPALAHEVRQRLPHAMVPGPLAAVPGPLAAVPGPLARNTDAANGAGAVRSALWIEPLTATWEADIKTLAGSVQPGGRLVVIASQPLALLLGKRSLRGNPRPWGQGGGLPAGARIGGISGLLRRLASAGFRLEARYGLHSASAIAANLLDRGLERWGRPDLGDRLHFWARLHYCVPGLMAGMSTVALVVANKVVR